jgi:hypothetical protein
LNTYDRIYNILLEAPLSQPARRTLALNRLSKKSFARKHFSRGLNQVTQRELSKKDIRTNPNRDVVRAAAKAQLGENKTLAKMHATYKKLKAQGKVGPAVARAYKAGTYNPKKDYSAENDRITFSDPQELLARLKARASKIKGLEDKK